MAEVVGVFGGGPCGPRAGLGGSGRQPSGIAGVSWAVSLCLVSPGSLREPVGSQRFGAGLSLDLCRRVRDRTVGLPEVTLCSK